MDPLGLLLEIVAVAVYPGGLFLAGLVWLIRRAGGLPGGMQVDGGGLVAIVAATLAASMASMPGSPAASIPPPGGATPNLIACVLLLVVAGSLAAPQPWSLRRLTVLVLAGVSLVLMGLVGSTFSISAIAGSGGGTGEAARILAAATVLVALPLVIQPHRGPPAAALARAVVAAATVEVVLGTLIPPSLSWPAASIALAALVAATAAYALLLRVGRSAMRRGHPSLVVLDMGCFAAATVVAVIAARP
jgi:hypothetical protein